MSADPLRAPERPGPMNLRERAPAASAVALDEDCHVGGCGARALFELLGRSYVLDLLNVHLQAPEQGWRFLELQRRLSMSPNTLTTRLKALVDGGLLDRQAFSEIPPRVEYRATEKAVELGDVFYQLCRWAERHRLVAAEEELATAQA